MSSNLLILTHEISQCMIFELRIAGAIQVRTGYFLFSISLFARVLWSRKYRGSARSLSGGLIFIYSCSAKLISFEIHCFQGV